MLQTVYYDPFRTFAGSRRVRRARSAASDARLPEVDIVESKAQYQLFIDLPGVAMDAIDVIEENNVLTISAKKKGHIAADGETVTLAERRAGKFLRSFTLPDDADTTSIAAESRDGVLHVLIQRRQPDTGKRRIDVSD